MMNIFAVQVEVNTPEEHMGDVIGDLNSRRGLIGEFIDKPANMKLVKASVPLSEMFQYVSTLRGMTKGAPSCRSGMAPLAIEGFAASQVLPQKVIYFAEQTEQDETHAHACQGCVGAGYSR